MRDYGLKLQFDRHSPSRTLAILTGLVCCLASRCNLGYEFVVSLS